MDTSSLCRICLESGALKPIFDDEESKSSVLNKLSVCLCEKIENIDGFPSNICDQCSINLAIAYDFVLKFKESNKLLENGFASIKQEREHCKDECSGFDDYGLYTEVEIDITSVKKAEDYNDTENINENLIEDLLGFIKPESLSITKLKNKQNVKNKNKKLKKSKKSNIASSILEGPFTWTGEQWCPSSKEEMNDSKIRVQQQHKIKIPKEKATKQKKVTSRLCDLCGQVFKNQDKLKYHINKIHHPLHLPCPECPKVCTTLQNLNRHVKRKHCDIKNFVCSFCGKTYAFQGELNSHTSKVHNKDKMPKPTFSCSFCGKSYACKKSVVLHERAVHTGLRPAVCSICDKAFSHDDYLKEHMRLHTGETPFKCPVCGRGYAQRCNMKSHIRIHRRSELDEATQSKIKPNYLRLMKD